MITIEKSTSSSIFGVDSLPTGQKAELSPLVSILFSHSYETTEGKEGGKVIKPA